MPIVRPIYKTMKQIFETLFSKTGSSFRKVALVEFPAPGMWSLVFLSQPPGGDLVKKLPQGEHVSAFMPCTPNPTTGFFFYVKRKDLIELDISVENAMTLLISAGMVQPDAEAQKKLASLAATAKARSPGQAQGRGGRVDSTRPDQLDRFVFAKQIEQLPQRLAARRRSVASRDRISAASSRAAPRYFPCTSGRAI